MLSWVAMNQALTVPTERVSFTTSDGVTVVGHFIPAKKLRAPGLLLLHMLGRDRHTFDSLLEPLRAAGFALFAIDFRGHGESTVGPAGTLNWEDFKEKEWQTIANDVEAAVETLKKRRGVDPESLAIVGASVGANAALIAGAADPSIKSLVLLSPGLDYRGIKTSAISNVGAPTMIISATGDSYSFDSSKTLATALARATLVEEKGDAHGTNMFVANPALVQRIADHLTNTLSKTSHA
jgi:alpha-beta hydrolase superfamily lysophospholipase